MIDGARHLRVVMVSEFLPPSYSGAGRQAMRLAEGLAKRGVDVLLVGPRAPGAPTLTKVGHLLILRLPGSGTFAHRRIGRAIFLLQLAVVLVVVAPWCTVIHVHGVFWAATVCALLARASHKPLLLKMTRSGDDDIRTLSEMATSTRVLCRLRALPIREASSVIAINSDMLGGALDAHYPTARLRLLCNAVDTRLFRLPSSAEREHARRRLGIEGWAILFAGGMLRHKGLHPLLHAISEALREAPDLRLLIVGPMDPANPEIGVNMELETHQLMRELGLDSVSSSLGLLDTDEMRNAYWASHLYVSASTREGVPNALLEALSCGLPSVLAAIPAMHDIAKEYPFLPQLDPQDPASIARAILEVRRNPSWQSLSRRCRAATVSVHSFDALEIEYVRLYSGLRDGLCH